MIPFFTYITIVKSSPWPRQSILHYFFRKYEELWQFYFIFTKKMQVFLLRSGFHDKTMNEIWLTKL